MKNLFTLIVILWASLSWAGDIQLARMSVAVVGGGTAGAAGTWYYSAGSDNYPTPDTDSSNTVVFGGSVVITAGSYITKLRMKTSEGGSENLKLGLYTIDGTTLNRVDDCNSGPCNCTVPTTVATGWNECTLPGTGHAVTPTVTFAVIYISDTSGAIHHAIGAGTYWVTSSQTYADFPVIQYQGVSTGSTASYAVAVYAQ